MRLRLVVPDRSGGMPSGGDRYDAALAGALRDRGWEVETVRVGGGWPWPGRRDLAALAEALRGPAGDGSGPVLIDGLLACTAPEAVERCAADRPTGILVHSRLTAGSGVSGAAAAELDQREARALAAAGTVMTPSGWAARDLRERYGLGEVVVAHPGVEQAEVALGLSARVTPGGRGTPRLLALAAVTPLKNHRVLLEALAEVRDLSWTAICAGPVPDIGHLRSLRGRAEELDIAHRLSWPGAVLGQDLERLWSTTDLLVHPSRSETYGLVVAEAHAHGIPTVVGKGTGAVEALAGTDAGEDVPTVPGSDAEGGADAGRADLPGTAVATDSPEELADVLRRWLTDAGLRERWRRAALERREQLTGWDATAVAVEGALAGMGG